MKILPKLFQGYMDPSWSGKWEWHGGDTIWSEPAVYTTEKLIWWIWWLIQGRGLRGGGSPLEFLLFTVNYKCEMNGAKIDVKFELNVSSGSRFLMYFKEFFFLRNCFVFSFFHMALHCRWKVHFYILSEYALFRITMWFNFAVVSYW